MAKCSLFTKRSREDEHFCVADAYSHVYIEFVGIQLVCINLCARVYVYIYSVQLNVSNINTKKHYCTKKNPNRSTSPAGCETETADLLLGLGSLNIAQKMLLTHLSLLFGCQTYSE